MQPRSWKGLVGLGGLGFWGWAVGRLGGWAVGVGSLVARPKRTVAVGFPSMPFRHRESYVVHNVSRLSPRYKNYTLQRIIPEPVSRPF